MRSWKKNVCHYLHKNPQFTNDPELGEREIFNFRRDPRFPILLFSFLVFFFFFQIILPYFRSRVLLRVIPRKFIQLRKSFFFLFLQKVIL